MPDRCWTVLSAERSAVSIARALPSSRIRSVPAATWSPSSTSRSIRTSGSSARKNASAIGSPATVIASRLSITPVKCASAGMTAVEVISPASPRSSASVAATKASRSKFSSAKGWLGIGWTTPDHSALLHGENPPATRSGDGDVIRIGVHLGALADHAPVEEVVAGPDIDATAKLILDFVAKRLAGFFESDDALAALFLASALRRLVVRR